MGFTSLQMTKLFETMTAQLEAFGADSDAEETREVLEKLKETHATSAGLKAFCTWNGLETIEKCRASCGGHGYSSYTGLASMVRYIPQRGRSRRRVANLLVFCAVQ